MRMETEKGAPQAMSITPASIIKDICVGQPRPRPKFAISVEKKIEHLWLESEARGWNFNDFVVVLMEVLTVLHHRNKLRNGADGDGGRATRANGA